MLRIYVKDDGKYREIPNGPFPISAEALNRCRDIFAAEWTAAKPLTGAKLVPQTAARDILNKECPKLSSFDRLMIGFAVTNSKIKTKEV